MELNRIMQIIDGKSKFDMSFSEYIQSPIWRDTAKLRKIFPPRMNDISEKNKTVVHISTGRLVAQCPNCNSAEYVWYSGPHVMMCANCGNKDIQGKLRRVLFPYNYDIIVHLLLLRPNPDNQNWKENESVEDLITENILHGVKNDMV